MKRVPVESTMIASVGYDPDKHILEVEFNSGAIWHYLDVPPEEYAGLMAAESKGRYMHTHILHGAYVDVPMHIPPQRRGRF